MESCFKVWSQYRYDTYYVPNTVLNALKINVNSFILPYNTMRLYSLVTYGVDMIMILSQMRKMEATEETG